MRVAARVPRGRCKAHLQHCDDRDEDKWQSAQRKECQRAPSDSGTPSRATFSHEHWLGSNFSLDIRLPAQTAHDMTLAPT